MVKIMLLVPPLKIAKEMHDLIKVSYPIGLAYIASNLEKNGFNVKILDTLVEGWETKIEDQDSITIGISDDKIKEIIKEENPDFFGISSMFTTQSEQPHKLAKLIKEVFPNKKIIIGGPHASANAKEILNDKNFDFVVIGEGEITLVNLLNNIDNPEKVNGIAFRKKEKIEFTNPADFIHNLDELPFPAYHLLNMKKYKEYTKKGFSPRRYVSKGAIDITLITSRGCPFNCIFCAVHKTVGFKWRPRSSKNVVDEIEFLNKEYGIKTFFFEDDNFSFDLNRAKDILRDILNRKLQITWSAPNGIRADILDEELIDLIKKTNCLRIRIAIEHGDQIFLNEVVNKRMDLDKLKTAVKLLRKKKINVDGFFILGIPGETDKTARNSINFAKELSAFGLNPILGMAMPFPGTRMYDICKEKNYLIKENLNQKDYQLSNTKQSIINTPTMSTERLKYWYSQFLKETFFIRMITHPFSLLNLNIVQESFRHPIRVFNKIVICNKRNIQKYMDKQRQG